MFFGVGGVTIIIIQVIRLDYVTKGDDIKLKNTLATPY